MQLIRPGWATSSRTPITVEQQFHHVPIDVEQFESADHLRESTTSERVVRFLGTHADKAYTRREIAEAVDADIETVGTTLTRLKERSLVRHRQPYWTFTDDRDDVIDIVRERYGDSMVADIFDEGAAGANPETQPETPHRAAAQTFFDRAQNHLGDAIEALYLFGSVASDMPTQDSDVDVLVVVSDDADYAAVDEHLLDLAYDVQLEFGVRVETHVMRSTAFAERRAGGDPFVQSVLEAGQTDV